MLLLPLAHHGNPGRSHPLRGSVSSICTMGETVGLLEIRTARLAGSWPSASPEVQEEREQSGERTGATEEPHSPTPTRVSILSTPPGLCPPRLCPSQKGPPASLLSSSNNQIPLCSAGVACLALHLQGAQGLLGPPLRGQAANLRLLRKGPLWEALQTRVSGSCPHTPQGHTPLLLTT